MQCDDLIAGLHRLERTGRRLAGGHERRHLRSVAVEIADDPRLNAHGVLQARDGILPARLRIGDERLTGLAGGSRRVRRREGAVDLLHVVGDALGLRQELLRLLDGLLDLLQRRIRQAREIASLIDQHLRFVLERGDLVGDLLQRVRGGDDVLRVIRRIEHQELRGRRSSEGDGEGERARRREPTKTDHD